MENKENKAVFNNLEIILQTIGLHRNPDLLVWDYKNIINTKTSNNKKLDEYFLLLMSVGYFYKKIMRYEIYFSEFYPETKNIKNTEALEYHIHSYLEDMDILRNKITSFLGVLKKDLKRVALNKQEIDVALTKFIENVEKTFTEVKNNRHPHHHKGYKFLNSDLVDSEMLTMMLAENFPLKDRVNIPEVQKKAKEHFEKAKNDYIGLAKKNNEQIMGLINVIFEKNESFIYKVLNIKSLKEIMGMMKSQTTADLASNT